MQGLKNMLRYWGSTKEMSEYLGVSCDTLLNLVQRENMSQAWLDAVGGLKQVR